MSHKGSNKGYTDQTIYTPGYADQKYIFGKFVWYLLLYFQLELNAMF